MTLIEKTLEAKKRRKLKPVVGGALVCRLQALRVDQGISLDDLCKATSMSKSNLHRIEHGGDVQLTTAYAIASAFGCEVQYIWPPPATRKGGTK